MCVAVVSVGVSNVSIYVTEFVFSLSGPDGGCHFMKSRAYDHRLGQSSDLGSVGSRICNTFCGDSLLLLGR